MVEHNKLVRDRIPEICEANGDQAHTRILHDDTEYLEALTAKLCEEAAEVQETPSLGELADVLEVIRCIGKALGYTSEQIEDARKQKEQERGSFLGRIFLIRTD